MGENQRLFFPGATLAHVEAALLLASRDDSCRGYQVAKYQLSADRQPPTRQAWQMFSFDNEQSAALRLYQVPGGCWIELTDGAQPFTRHERPPVGKPLVLLAESLAAILGAGAEATGRPPEPDAEAHLDKWFEWYETMKARGFDAILRDIADAKGLSLGHVKNEHAKWIQEHGAES